MTVPAAPLDLDEFRQRSERITRARDAARRDAERYGLEQAEAEFEYRHRKAAAFASYRLKDSGVAEAEILAEGDVAEWRRKRDVAQVLKKSAEQRIHELEANRAMLRAQAEWARTFE